LQSELTLVESNGAASEAAVRDEFCLIRERLVEEQAQSHAIHQFNLEEAEERAREELQARDSEAAEAAAAFRAAAREAAATEAAMARECESLATRAAREVKLSKRLRAQLDSQREAAVQESRRLERTVSAAMAEFSQRFTAACHPVTVLSEVEDDVFEVQEDFEI